MAVTWYLKRGTETKTLAGWGAEGVAVSFVNLAVDALTFRVPLATLGSGTEGWARDVAVELLRDSTRVFAGIVENNPEGTAEAGSESITVRVVGPWWFLTRITYTQSWQVWDTSLNDGDGGTATGTKSRVVLGQADNGDRLTSGQVITDALTKASAGGTRFTVGTIDPTVSVPLDEVVDLACSEVVLKMIRWTPDCVGWFDYTTSPPTFHCRRSSGLSLVTYSAGATVESWTSVPRADLQMDGVILKYESTTTNGEGDEYYRIVEERAPAEATEGNPRVLVMTIGLEGASSSVQSAKITTETIPGDLNTALTWWRARLKVLVGVADADIVISATRTKTQAQELLDGSIPDWLSSTANLDTDTISGTVTYKKNGQTFKADISHKMTVCSLASDTHKKVSRSPAEAAPVGLAAAYFASVGTLYYQGAIQLAYEDLPAGPWMGFRVQAPTGGAGVLQSVNLDIDAGRASLSFGPADHLGVGDMIEFLRANRTRMTSRSHGRRGDASAGSDVPEIQTGGASPRHDTVSSPAGQLTVGETTPSVGLVVPAPTANFQTLVALTSAEDSSVASGQRAWRPSPPRIMYIP